MYPLTSWARLGVVLLVLTLIFSFGASVAIVTAQTPDTDPDTGDVTVIDIDPDTDVDTGDEIELAPYDPIEDETGTPVAPDESEPVEATPDSSDAGDPEAGESAAEVATPDSELVSLAAEPTFTVDTHVIGLGDYLTINLTGYLPGWSVKFEFSAGGFYYLNDDFHVMTSAAGTAVARGRIIEPDLVSPGKKIYVRSMQYPPSGYGDYVQVGPVIVLTLLDPFDPRMRLSRPRTTVNVNVTATVWRMPVNADFDLIFRRAGGSTVTLATGVRTSWDGIASVNFKVPYAPGGVHTIQAVQGNTVLASQSFTIAPRIKVTPAVTARGATVDVSLAGYGKKESVRIRWKVGNSWVQLVTVLTSNTGSLKVNVSVPNNATIGPNSARGDGTIWRQQTNAITVGA